MIAQGMYLCWGLVPQNFYRQRPELKVIFPLMPLISDHIPLKPHPLYTKSAFFVPGLQSCLTFTFNIFPPPTFSQPSPPFTFHPLPLPPPSIFVQPSPPLPSTLSSLQSNYTVSKGTLGQIVLGMFVPIAVYWIAFGLYDLSTSTSQSTNDTTLESSSSAISISSSASSRQDIVIQVPCPYIPYLHQATHE